MHASEPTVRFYYGLLYGRYCDEESSSIVDDDLVPLCLDRVGSRVRITLRYREGICCRRPLRRQPGKPWAIHILLQKHR